MGAPHRFKSVLITGASGGLGGALACELAGPGVRLALGGRDHSRLANTAAACRAAGAEVSTREIDVAEAQPMAEWVRGEDAVRALDLVIACAGVSGERGAPGDDPRLSEWIYRVNVIGLLNTVEPVLPAMRARRGGQIALIASVSGFRGFPGRPAYSGSKAAVIAMGQAWREALAADGVGVTTISPGYIRTAMTARHRFRMPFLIEPDAAARRAVRALDANRASLVFPWPLPVLGWLLRALPPRLTSRFLPGGTPRSAPRDR